MLKLRKQWFRGSVATRDMVRKWWGKWVSCAESLLFEQELPPHVSNELWVGFGQELALHLLLALLLSSLPSKACLSSSDPENSLPGVSGSSTSTAWGSQAKRASKWSSEEERRSGGGVRLASAVEGGKKRERAKSIVSCDWSDETGFLVLAGKQILNRVGEKSVCGERKGSREGLSQQNEVKWLLGRMTAMKVLWFGKGTQLHVRATSRLVCYNN